MGEDGLIFPLSACGAVIDWAEATGVIIAAGDFYEMQGGRARPTFIDWSPRLRGTVRRSTAVRGMAKKAREAIAQHADKQWYVDFVPLRGPSGGFHDSWPPQPLPPGPLP